MIQLMYKNREFIKEVKAVSKLAGLSFHEMLALNFIYEVFARKACTSILFRDINGDNNLGRNLDYSIAEFMKPITFTGHFYRNNTLIAKASILPGFIGFHTAHRLDGYAISLNQRNK